MKKKLVLWTERYLYSPTWQQSFIATLLLPLSWIYCSIMKLRFLCLRAQDFGISIISVGNLTIGGSGKTPLTIQLATKYRHVAIILRGYGRSSKGLHVISDGFKILKNVNASGDEAMIYALKLPNAIVIVSENRKKAIIKAKSMGAKLIFLDDGYSKHNIKKLDLLIHTKTNNNYCLPSGAFRERIWQTKKVELVYENLDFTRKVRVINPTKNMILVTAIARASRLDKFLPEVVAKYCFEDHHFFTKDELEKILQKTKADSILVTFKDYVKIKDFGFAISILELSLDIDKRIFKLIDTYRSNYENKK